MRRKIVIGNWKMNTTIDAAINLVVDIKDNLEDNLAVLCVPYTHIGTIQEFADDRIGVGAQNLSEFESGAYTGEISNEMLASLGVEYVIIGHSERRSIYNESNALVNTKALRALEKDIMPIICCGESLELRKSGAFMPFIQEQIKAAFANISEEDAVDCIIAYEPIWAIGTGETASVDQAQEVHAFIRNEMAQLYNETLAENISIIYGGSVKPVNSKELFSAADIDGALVGGASLKALDFIQIIKNL